MLAIGEAPGRNSRPRACAVAPTVRTSAEDSPQILPTTISWRQPFWRHLPDPGTRSRRAPILRRFALPRAAQPDIVVIVYCQRVLSAVLAGCDGSMTRYLQNASTHLRIGTCGRISGSSRHEMVRSSWSPLYSALLPRIPAWRARRPLDREQHPVSFHRDSAPAANALLRLSSAGKSQWRLRDDLLCQQLLAGGESGRAAIVPGNPDESYLVELITPANGEAEMPAGKPPLADELGRVDSPWIEQGAEDDSPPSARAATTWNIHRPTPPRQSSRRWPVLPTGSCWPSPDSTKCCCIGSTGVDSRLG